MAIKDDGNGGRLTANPQKTLLNPSATADFGR
jgi:hypothetical protein